MNRKKFMEELEVLLQGIAPEERMEALQYYSDYFDDAGIEQEAQIIRELGTPSKVAEEVKAGLRTDDENTAEYRGTGHEDSPVPYEAKAQTGNAYEYADISEEEKVENKERTNKTVKMVLIACLVLFGLPIMLPLALGFFAAALGLVVAIVAVCFAAIIVVGALVIVGIALVVTGTAMLVSRLAEGLVLIGLGLIVGIIGLVITVGAIFACVRIIPIIFSSVGNLCKKLLGKRKAV